MKTLFIQSMYLLSYYYYSYIYDSDNTIERLYEMVTQG